MYTYRFSPLKTFIRRTIGLFLLSFWGVGVALAQTDVAQKIEQHRDELQIAAEQMLEASEDELLELREEIRDIRLMSENETAPLRTRIAELEADLERLGPEPEGGIRQTPDIRKTLQDEYDKLNAIVGQADLNIIEAGRLLVDIGNRRRDAFYERVLERDRLPFTLSSAQLAFDGLKTDWTTFQSRHDDWKASFEDEVGLQTAFFALVTSIIIALILLGPAPRWADRSLLKRFQTYEATPTRRVAIAALRVITRALPALVGATLIYQTASANGVVTEATSRLVGSVLLAIATVFVVEDVASAVFAPKQPKWRLFPLESEKARGVRFLIVLIVIVFSTNAVMIRFTEWLGSSRELVTLFSALIMLIGGVLLFLIARPQLWQLSESGANVLSQDSENFWRWIRSFATIVAVLSIFAVLIGYIALSRFVLTSLYFLSFLFIAAWFSRALLGELANRVGARVSHSVSSTAQNQMSDSRDDQRLLVFWLKLLIDVAGLVIIVPVAFLILGAEWTDMRNWLFDALFGIQIGGITISLVNIFSAMMAMFVILVITRFIQRTTDKRIFEPARMESGLRNTFRTLIGYVGLVLGVMVAVGTLGFPLANLAIVAGALSVGIGFGLQSIVNNFVSGLILLFERPIKVGDWIVTSAGEGVVKRISVRSTEIETFDWASVIIPNSELISAPVTNWTHKNRYTRIIIPVGVSYNSDPEMVSELLLKEAKANRRTLSYPAPLVYFSGYGDSSLDFEVRIFINNVDDRIPVRNELRLAIFKALKSADVEIPFPQRDLHVRSIAPGTIMAGQSKIEPSQQPSAADGGEDKSPRKHAKIDIPPDAMLDGD